VSVHAPYGFSTHAQRWLCPVREHWNLEAHQRLSPEFERRLSYSVSQTGSYEKTAAMSACWGSPISDDAVHALVQRVGKRAVEADAPAPPPPAGEPAFSLVIMLDGWMVRERGTNWGAPPLGAMLERVAWHEVKSAVIYRLEKRTENASGRGLLIEKNVVACAPGTEPLEFGAAVQQEALRCGLARALEVFVVADGAIWIWRLIMDRFAEATHTLDFYHASEHLWALARHLHAHDEQAATQWVKPLLHQLLHDPQHRVMEKLEELLLPSPVENAPMSDPIVEREVEYLRAHRGHLDYANLAARGAPIGSGAMESACSQFQDRFKRRGQFWTRHGLRNLLALDVAVKNRSYTHLWS
jgi:hypothetical protein